LFLLITKVQYYFEIPFIFTLKRCKTHKFHVASNSEIMTKDKKKARRIIEMQDYNKDDFCEFFTEKIMHNDEKCVSKC